MQLSLIIITNEQSKQIHLLTIGYKQSNVLNGKKTFYFITQSQQPMKTKGIKFPNEQQTELYDKITKIQTKIIDRLTFLKKNKKYNECRHLQNANLQCEQYDANINYYDKFWKTFLVNEISHQRIEELKQYLDDYTKKIEEIEDLFDKHEEMTGIHSRRRNRRPAEEITKRNECPYPKCFKIYGSQVSLNLHIKLKHNGGNKTDRQKAAELIWQARQKGKPVPQFYINLPPNFIEQYGLMTHRISKLRNQQENYSQQRQNENNQ